MESATITLNNGVAIPRVGLGTFRARGADVQAAVKAALAAGIRHIDTASIYKNESDIAAAIASSPVPRASLFLTSKLSPYEMGASKALKAFESCLNRLGTDYVDLMLIHWPGVAKQPLESPANAVARRETWAVLEECYRAGKARAIGVSNYEERHLAELLSYAAVAPAVNQFECHPRHPESALRAACERAGVAPVAYASLGCGKLIGEVAVQSIASQVGRSPAQVLLRWGLQRGCCVIPKSVHPDRIAEFAPDRVLGWNLDSDQIAALDALGANPRKYCWDASGVL